MQSTFENNDDDPSFFMSSKIIEDFPEEDRDVTVELQISADQTKIIQMLEEDALKKEDFLSDDSSLGFTQMVVISQIRRDFTNDDPFLRHLLNVEKAIKKAIRNHLMACKVIENKEAWKNNVQSFVRIFYLDINIGFITSTGQIKSTAFIFVSNNIVGYLHNKRINLQFNKIALKLTLNFFDPQTIQPVTGPFYNEIKNAFIRSHKFQNHYIVLSKTPQETKPGVSIFFVYKPIDDQIYAVKKTMLQAKSLQFTDIFQIRCNINDPDQRRINEARILSKLTHPNILRLYDWWIELEEEGGHYYLYMVLEYCSFPGFKYQPNDLLSFAYFYMNPMNNRQKLEAIKEITLQILAGLEYIHKRGIVHRDLKPENVFVTITINGELQIKLADFDKGLDLSNKGIDEKQKQELPLSDEFYGIGVLLLHLVLTFPGEPSNRNHYVKTFCVSETEDNYALFDSWATKLVRNRHPEFQFVWFKKVLDLAKKLTSNKIKEHQEIKMIIQSLI